MLVVSGPIYIYLMTKRTVGTWGRCGCAEIALGLSMLQYVGTPPHKLPSASVTCCGFGPQNGDQGQRQVQRGSCFVLLGSDACLGVFTGTLSLINMVQFTASSAGNRKPALVSRK